MSVLTITHPRPPERSNSASPFEVEKRRVRGGRSQIDSEVTYFERYAATRWRSAYSMRVDQPPPSDCHAFEIQRLSRHSKLSTTELYTRVSINLLRQVYAATHPAAKELLEALAQEARDEESEDEI